MGQRQVERVADGIWSIPVPIPGNPLGVTLVYLLESAAGPVLVDTGWNHPDAWAALDAGVVATGHRVEECYGVLVTHHHPDHHGLAGAVRDRAGCWIALHAADTTMVRRHRGWSEGAREAWMQRAREMLDYASAPAEEAAEILAVEARSNPPIPALPDRDLPDGQLLDVPGWRVRALWSPGHSPGHTCFVLEDHDLLLSGDHLLPEITPHVGLYVVGQPDMDPLADYLDSLTRIAAIGPQEVLPAHEHRFSGALARATAIRAHHDERLAELAAAVGEQPRTMWDLTRDLSWNRPWDQLGLIQRRLAIAELFAHLRWLERRGHVRRHGDAYRLLRGYESIEEARAS